jgi:hypothetical protein
MSIRNSWLIFLIFILVSACKKPPIIVSDQAPKKEFAYFAIDEIDFIYFTSKAKIHYKDRSNEFKANGNIRIRKDSVIWISVNAAAGFEAFRILINKDSIHVLDRLQNDYRAYDYPSLSRKLNVNLNYRIIQSIILGNLMVERNQEDKVSKPDSLQYLLSQNDGNLSIKNFVNIKTRKIEKVDIKEGKESNQLIIKYSNFVLLGTYLFPAENNISLNYKDGNAYQTTIHIEHNKTECPDKEINFPFNVPNKFNRK